MGDSYQNCPNQACGHRLITPNQQTLCIETNIYYQKYKITKLQNNFVNGAMLIIMNRVINIVGEIWRQSLGLSPIYKNQNIFWLFGQTSQNLNNFPNGGNMT